MGLRKKVSAEKKEVPRPQGCSEKPSENEIDLIFGKKKRRGLPKNQETLSEGGIESGRKGVKKTKPSLDKEERKKGEKQSRPGTAGKSLSAATEAPPKPRKKTVDGLTIYGEDELKWNSRDAGRTPLCPFNCECCF